MAGIWVLVACSVATSRQAVVSPVIRKERGEGCNTFIIIYMHRTIVHRWADYNKIIATNT